MISALLLLPRHALAAGLALAALLLVPFAAGVAQPVFSGTQYTVTTLVDEDNGNLIDTNGTGTSLREAVKYSAAGDRIVFGSLVGSAFLTLGVMPVSHDLIIDGPGSAIIEINGNDLSGIFLGGFGVKLEIEGLTLASGRAVFGAAIVSQGGLWLSNVAVRWSTATQRGGAVYHFGADSLVIAGSRFEYNEAYLDGGAIAAVTGTARITATTFESNRSGASGGAVFIHNSASPSLFANSSFSRNSADGSGGAIAVSASGSLALDRCTMDENYSKQAGGGITNAGTLAAALSTISGNIADLRGGGINNSGTLGLDYVTVARNSSATGGGLYDASIVNIRRTLIAENSAGAAPDVSGSVTSIGNNLVRNGSGSTGWNGTTDLIGTVDDPMEAALDDLRLNGGSTKTHALLICSRAIDAAIAGPVLTPDFDQRGVARSFNGNHDLLSVPDIGAYEVLSKLDNEPPTINEHPAYQVYLDSTGNASVTADKLLISAYDNCEILSTSVSKLTFTCADTGTVNVTLTATDRSFNVTTKVIPVKVFDVTAPVITLPANVVVNASASTCNTTLTAAQLGTATATSTCGGATISNNAPSSFPVGVTVVTWYAADNNGNVASGQQTVTVNDATAPVINNGNALPAISVNTPANSCTVPRGQVLTTEPAASDNCSFVLTNDAPALFPLGATVVTWTATDPSGNFSTKTQTVTVVDSTLPLVFAPPDLSLVVDFNSCTRDSANVDLGAPVSSDNCSLASLTNNKPASFPIGTTVVTWTATDGSGNVATATQNVTVFDDSPPTVVAPPDIEVEADSNSCFWTVIPGILGSATSIDNCSAPTVTNSAGSSLSVGTHRVIWTAIDGNGNRMTDVQIVIVVGDAPTITDNLDMTVNTDPGKAGAVVTYTAPTSASSCSEIEIIRTGGLGSGDFFPVGTTTVSYMAIDGSNQIATSSFTVTVVDNEAPQISVRVAPVNLWPADNKMKEIKATVEVLDNVPGATAVLTSITCNQNANGDIAAATTGVFDIFFELRAERDNSSRIYTITYTATDVALNSTSASATVTVPEVKPKDFEGEVLPIPVSASLAQNYPNPFNPSTIISFGTPADQHVDLRIYNAMGVPVRTLVSSQLGAGEYTVEWDGRDDNGLQLSSGVYLYMLRAGGDHVERKMILAR